MTENRLTLALGRMRDEIETMTDSLRRPIDPRRR